MCRASWALSYVFLAWTGWCLWVHYRSYALLRLVHLRHGVEGLPGGRVGRRRSCCRHLHSAALLGLLSSCALACASAVPQRPFEPLFPAAPGDTPRQRLVGFEHRGWPTVRDSLLKLISPSYVSRGCSRTA